MTFMNFEVNKGKQLSVWPFTFKKKVIWHRISGLKFVFAICQEFAILSLVKYLKRLGQTMRIDTTLPQGLLYRWTEHCADFF